MATVQFEADSNATLVDSFSVLVTSLYNHANDLKDVSQLKSSPDGVDQQQLVDLEHRIRAMEHSFKALRQHLEKESTAIAGVQNLRNVVHEQTAQIQKICGHLPEHLPQQQHIFGANGANAETTSTTVTQKRSQQALASAPPAVAKENDPSAVVRRAKTTGAGGRGGGGGTKGGRKGKGGRKAASKCTDRIPRLPYLTVDEFSAVPSYVRGRLSLNKVSARGVFRTRVDVRTNFVGWVAVFSPNNVD